MLKHQRKTKSSSPQLPILLTLLFLSVMTLVTVIIGKEQTNKSTNAAAALTPKKISGYYVAWDKDRGWQTIQQNADILYSVTPFAYAIDASGNIGWDPDGGAALVTADKLAYLKQNNILVIPAISNLVDGTWNKNNITSNMLNNSTARGQHIAAIVNLVTTNNYDGIDIDYENLNSSDRSGFSAFLTELGAALHANGKLLTATVNGKTSEPGNWAGVQAQDYKAIGAAVDEVRIMLYSYDTPNIGPIAPKSWIQNVLSFAITQIPPEKVMQGAPLYAYDWTGTGSSTPKELDWTSATAKASQYGSTVNWDNTNQVPWFTYSASGQNHTVYFENAQSAQIRYGYVNQYNIGGIFFWKFGGEDPAMWPLAKTTLAYTKAGTATPTGTTAPTQTTAPTAVPTSAPTPTKAPSPSPTAIPTPTIATANGRIYVDALTPGWTDASYYATVNWTNTSPVYQGTRSIKFTANKGWAGLSFDTPSGFSTAGYNYISFAIRATKSNQNFGLYTENSSGQLLKFVPLSGYGGYPPTNSWKIYKIPLSAVNAVNKQIGAFVIQNNTSTSQSAIYVDQVQLEK